MARTTTISKKLPELKSMQYQTLRELGVRHIEELAGKLWTDHNSHDPGVTMLEALAYTLTDLGYRISYDIKDLLAQGLDNSDGHDIQNFYTARQILPNCPLTINDYRKLIIDVELTETIDGETIRYGVRNAWVKCSDKAECGIYVGRKKSRLSLEPVKAGQQPYYVKTLYDVLLEFSDHDKYGGLNENTYNGSEEQGEVEVKLEVEFPRWDEGGIDWSSKDGVLAGLKASHIRYRTFGLPSGHQLEVRFGDGGQLEGITHVPPAGGGTGFSIDTATLKAGLESLLGTMAGDYLEKAKRAFRIVEAVEARLHAHRNLCDDWFRFRALKVEEILLCADIELKPEADVETVEAAILHSVHNFLAPRVNFYTLEEMLNRCRRGPHYQIESIRKNKRLITFGGPLQEDINGGDTISLLDAGPNSGEYTLKCFRPNREDPNLTDVEVLESLASDTVPEGAYFMSGAVDEARCLSIDQIFEGPALEHGFIDDEELIKAERMKHIRVSDLIRVIMDVEGVVAVKSIQIANRPQDNDAGIPSRSVKWCLELAYEQDYIPRLDIEGSKLTYHKGLLPFIARADEVEEKLKARRKQDRPQKIAGPQLDLPAPTGAFAGLAEYTSVQEDLPLTYGIGPEGIPGLGPLPPEEQEQRLAKARQLKGYLMLYDQLIYNTLIQLSHVKDLFSMNGEKDQSGNYVIGKTYFSGSLENIVPDAAPLYVDKNNHAEKLQQITEGPEGFAARRNRFLDHLMARFSEAFADYALLAGKLYGAKAPMELVEDKLQFLSKYPELSAGRGKGMNYRDPLRIWHVDNVSGLEKRASLLLGIAPKSAGSLEFSDNYRVVFISSNRYRFQLWAGAQPLLESVAGYPSSAAAKAGIEQAILCGLYRENFQAVRTGAGGDYHLYLYCGEEAIASSEAMPPFPTEEEALAASDQLAAFAEEEFLNNPEANRHNLACPLKNYIYPFPEYDDSLSGETYEWKFALYDDAFGFPGQERLNAKLEIPLASIRDEQGWREALGRQLWAFILAAANPDQYEYRFVNCPRQDGPPYPEAFRYELRDQKGTAIAWTRQSEFSSPGDALAELTQFIYDKFFNHEGLHLIEHTLLRPRACTDLIFPVSFAGGKEKIGRQTQLLAPQRVPILYIQAGLGVVKVEGDITAELRSKEVRIAGSARSDGLYRVRYSELMDGNTLLELEGNTPLRNGKPYGELIYWKASDIAEADPASATIKAPAIEGAILERGQKVVLAGAAGKRSAYIIDEKSMEGGNVVLSLSEHIVEVRDALLPIHLDQDCEACQQEDPYSCVATVVLPYWPGRFPNMEMRRFTERTLRQEAPAHILLNICWVSCAHMHELELKYKKWLLEANRRKPAPYQRSAALGELIDALGKARNVYPHGVLHDCDSDETYEGAVILNQTFLGTF